jgi:hypothetical protein
LAVVTKPVIGAAAGNSHFVRIVLVRYQRSEGRLSQIGIEDRGSALGWELTLDGICIDGSFAQIVYFAKSHERPKADLRRGRSQ